MTRVALLTIDNREHYKKYAIQSPVFGVAPEALLQGLSRVRELEVHVISCLQKSVSSPAQLAANTFYHGLEVPKMGWMRTGYQGCIRAVRRKLREIRPDIVHGQGTERDCALSAIFSGYPNILTIHGNMAEVSRKLETKPWHFQWMAARLEDFVLPRTSGVLCNSAHTDALVARRTAKTWRVPNALRDAFFAPFSISPNAPVPVLLNVGGIWKLKRQVELLDCAEKLHAKGYRFELRFIGELNMSNSYGAEFASRILRAEKAGFARHLPYMGVADLIAQFDKASALIHVPIEESFGLVVAEALARNLKVFATRVGGVRDIVAGVEGAELFEMNDWSNLASAVACWLDAGFSKPATASEEMARRYHPDRIAKRHLEIYREVLNT